VRELGDQLPRTGVALLGRLGEQAVDHDLELGRQARVELAHPARLAVQDAVEHGARGRAGEGTLARHHLVEHRAEREEIGARVDRLAERLLRRHVGDGAERHARARQLGRLVGPAVGVVGRRERRLVLGELGEPEVEHLELARGAHEQVRRLDVAMNDAALMRRVERAGHLHRQVDGLRDGDRAGLQQLLDALALAQLHHDERLAVVLLDVVDDADVRVVERGGELGLAVEARERRGLGRQPRRQELERDVAAELHVVRAVHDAHAAGAQLGLDAIARDGLADHRRLMIAGGYGGGGRG
jgi:hypothetical protein